MSKIKLMVGTRPDGTRITFEEKDVDKIRFEQFTSIEINEVLSEKECLERYGKLPESRVTN